MIAIGKMFINQSFTEDKAVIIGETAQIYIESIQYEMQHVMQIA